MTRPANACSPGGRRGSTGPLIPCPPVAYAPTTSMTATMSPCRSIAPGLALSPSGPAIWSGASTMRSPAALRGSLLGPRNLALINDRQGTTLAAMRGDGTQEDNVTYFSKDPFGGLIGATNQGGSMNTETGYAGASTPNASGGFIYLRNRWYDPKTGRFLTQDPIGLAGGVNLYSYAGNDPVNYSDPFGLSPLDCRKVRCPTIQQIAMSTAVYNAGMSMLGASQRDRRERMAYLFNGPNGTVRVGQTYVGEVGRVRIGTDAPAPPDDAIGAVHTHPDETKGPDPFLVAPRAAMTWTLALSTISMASS